MVICSMPVRVVYVCLQQSILAAGYACSRAPSQLLCWQWSILALQYPCSGVSLQQGRHLLALDCADSSSNQLPTPNRITTACDHLFVLCVLIGMDACVCECCVASSLLLWWWLSSLRLGVKSMLPPCQAVFVLSFYKAAQGPAAVLLMAAVCLAVMELLV